MTISRDRRMPNFLILGAQKAGTTWLADVLRRQPGLFIPRHKELHYFTRAYGNGSDWYAQQFADVGDAICLGEATPNYLAANYPEYVETPERIRSALPDLRFIVLLREPIARAISAYMHHVMRGRFPLGAGIDAHFEQLLQAPISTAGILEFGLYAAQLERYFKLFDRRQFLVLCYESDLCAQPETSVARVLEFIGAPRSGSLALGQRRSNTGAKSRLAARLGATLSCVMRDDDVRRRFGALVQQTCRWVERAARARPLELGDETLRRMKEFYRADLEQLQGLLGKDAPGWACERQNGKG